MTTADIQSEIITQAAAMGVPSTLALAVARKESNFNPNAIGSSGEIGLFQLMPATARDLGISDPYNIHQNITGGLSLLVIEYNRFGNWEQALQAYNAGSPKVLAGKVPASSQAYARDVLTSAGLSSYGTYGVSEDFPLGLPPELAKLVGEQPVMTAGIPTFSVTGYGAKYIPWLVVILAGVLLADQFMD